MKTSEAGLDLIKKFEGLRLIPYKCQAGVFTVGFGHTAKEDIGPITKKGAEDYLRKDVTRFETAINSLVRVALSQNQFDALVSFVFNIGITAFQSSMLLAFLNDKQYDSAAAQLLKWHHVGGVDSEGLKRRRQAEHDLFIS
jgi:lysozyme